jgi:DNA repair photolyase
MQRPLFIADHSERLLCPLPLKIESYSGCTGRCAYCSRNGLRDPPGGVTTNSVQYIEKYFFRSGKGMERELIDQRSPIQIGPTSDPLQVAEKVHKNTLKVLKILQAREYPTVLTTKFPDVLCDPAYLRAMDGLPLAVQVSISSADPDILRRLEPGVPSLPRRLEAMAQLHEAGVHVQLRLWPYAPDLAGNVADLLQRVKDAGVQTVLANPLKVYHNGTREGINQALGRDYIGTTPLDYVNGGLFSIMSLEEQRREMGALNDLCRALGMDMLSCDDWPGSRDWRDCCGVGGLPGFRPSPWAYYVNGHRIQDHCSFDEYLAGLDCPWHEEFKSEWEAGKLARALPDVIFHPEDGTYSRSHFTFCSTSPQNRWSNS